MMTPDSGPTHGEDFGGHGGSIYFHPATNRATASLPPAQLGQVNPKRPSRPKQGFNDGSSFRGQVGAQRPSKPAAPRPVDNGYGG